jgi:ATP-binding cassette subfamily B protein
MSGKSDTLRRVIRLFATYRRRCALVALSIVGSSVLGLVNPLLLRRVIDGALPAHDLPLLALLAGAMVAVTLAVGATDTLQIWQAAFTGQRVLHDLRVALFARLQQVSLRFFTDTPAGEISSRVTADVSGVQPMLTATVSRLFADVVMTLSTAALMLALDVRLTLLCLVVLPLFVVPQRRAGRLQHRLASDGHRQLAELTALVDETLSFSGVLLTRAFGRRRRELERFSTASGALADVEVKRALTQQLFWTGLQALCAAVPALLYLVGGRAVANGTLTLGTVVMFVALQSRLFYGMGCIFGRHAQEIAGAMALFQRIFEYLDLPPGIEDQPGARPLREVRGEVEFDRVRFAWSGAEPALEEISFRARPGQLIALVGASGAGKSTIGHLLVRHYDVEGGAVRIDGHDVRDVSLASLTRAVGMVTQEVFLFHASVRENLLYARPGASDAELEAAARAAQIHERILELPHGYQTLVGERGYKLSGGERQRLAIARVLLKNAPILVLDEATNAVDSLAERLIQDALEPALRGRTTLAIAHRLSTVMRADQILVVEAGRIVERGTHEELRDRSGVYARILDEQIGVAPAKQLPRPRTGLSVA